MLLVAPGSLSWSRLGWPATTVSADWICLVTVSRTRPDGLPPTLSMNGLPAGHTHRYLQTTHEQTVICN